MGWGSVVIRLGWPVLRSGGIIAAYFFSCPAFACGMSDEVVSIQKQIGQIGQQFGSWAGQPLCDPVKIDTMKLIHRLTIQYESNIHLARTICPEDLKGDVNKAVQLSTQLRSSMDEELTKCQVPIGSY